MPDGEEVTVPVPVPALLTLSVKLLVVVVLKVAVTERAELMVTLQEPLPEHAPPQPAKLDPDAAAAVRVTTVPEE